jgi:hypothetical protein
VIDVLKKYFIFDCIFDLIDYDLNMQQLYNELKELRQIEYEPTYRFIFLHYDTEYYINHDTPGLTLTNLQKILESLDIPNYFCILLTQQNLQNMCNYVKKNLTNDNCSIDAISNILHKPCHPNIADKNLTLNEELIIKNYICLNGIARTHRLLIMALLKEKNLFDQGLVSYRGK